MADLASGGLEVQGLDGHRDRFRCVVQPDGDLCLFLSPEALESPSFDDDLRQHMLLVGHRLTSLRSVSRLVGSLHRLVVASALVLAGGKSVFDLTAGGQAAASLIRDPTILLSLVLLLLAPGVRWLVRVATGGLLRRLMRRKLGGEA